MADLCRRAQVPESTFRDWRDRFIAAGTAALQPNKPKVHPDWAAHPRKWPTQDGGRRPFGRKLGLKKDAIDVCQPLILWITSIRRTRRVRPAEKR